MSPLDRLKSDLKHARARAEREGRDRHMNPGRLRRDMLEQAEAGSMATKLEKQIATAEMLDAQGINWTMMAVTLQLILPDGSVFLAAEGEKLDEQIEIIRANEGLALGSQLREKLTIHALDVTLTREMAWVRDRMLGTSAPKFRTGFLADAGLLDAGQLTPLGDSTGFFREDEGFYGTYQRATPLGIAWIYSCYLRGNVPLTKAAQKVGPVPNIELAEISRTTDLPDESLPAELMKLAGW